MKMPAALATANPDRVPQWRPGHALTLLPCGDAGPFSSSPSSFSQDTRLPLVSPSMDSPVPALLPRPLVNLTVERRRMKEESAPPPCLSSSTTAPVVGVAGEERRKRFPILGPTRQETEMYFRTRRSSQPSTTGRIKAEAKRYLVTRSADRVILPDSTPTATPRLLARPSSGTTPTVPRAVSNISLATVTSSTDATVTTTTTTTVSTGTGNRIVNISARGRSQTHSKDCEEAGNSVSTSHSLPSTLEPGTAHSATSSHFPGPERIGGLQSAAMSSPALERLENSPEQSSATLPLPAFQHLHDSSSGSSPHRVVLAGGRKKSESSPFSEFGHQSPRLARTRREQTQKTLQPSKHGFHLRSKSPTFKRLVAATEKLQDTVAVGQNKNSGPRKDRRYSLNAGGGTASPGGIVLPAVAGVWDGEATEEGEGESDEDVTYLHPHPFLSSLPHTAYRSKLKSAAGTRGGGHKVTRSIGTTMSSNPKDPQVKGADQDLVHGLGAWEVDPLGMESGMDPMRVPVVGMSSDTHTELHLFLPRLADTVSEDGSGKLSPDRHCGSRPAENRTLNNVSQRGGKAAMPQIVASQRVPQRSHTFSQQVAERSGRPQERRFTSPVRVMRRDRTPNNRRRVLATPLVESYASYEPYLKGEHLKEKLEDLPTLISLDQE